MSLALTAKCHSLQAQIDALLIAVASAVAAIAALDAKIDALDAPPEFEPPKRSPGRPRKVQQ